MAHTGRHGGLHGVAHGGHAGRHGGGPHTPTANGGGGGVPAEPAGPPAPQPPAPCPAASAAAVPPLRRGEDGCADFPNYETGWGRERKASRKQAGKANGAGKGEPALRNAKEKREEKKNAKKKTKPKRCPPCGPCSMGGSLPSSARRRPVAASSARSAVTSWPAACSAPSMRSASCLLSSIMCRILA